MRNSTIALNSHYSFDRKTNIAIFVPLFVLAMAFGAYIRIPLPFTPVPITLQTFFVLLSGAMLGKRFGLLAQISYVAIGAFGLPVFQNYLAGPAALLGPTGGYIMGFIYASYVVGRLLENKDATAPKVFASFLAGIAIIYLCGAMWLVSAYKMPPVQALYVGILPFIPGDILKISLATAIYTKISKRTKELI